MFSYEGIPPLASFCSKFYLFFPTLGCGDYFLAPVGIVTSIIGRWVAGRLPRVSKFLVPKFSVHQTHSLPNQLRHRWECML
ncbi:NADH-ubiquinone oxidoreductase chain 2 [Linum grandiflorum]